MITSLSSSLNSTVLFFFTSSDGSSKEFTFSDKREYILDEISGKITINSVEEETELKIKGAEEIQDIYWRIYFYEEFKENRKERGFVKINDVKVKYFDLTKESLIIKKNESLDLGSLINLKIVWLRFQFYIDPY